jgi:hypothetical protein
LSDLVIKLIDPNPLNRLSAGDLLQKLVEIQTKLKIEEVKKHTLSFRHFDKEQESFISNPLDREYFKAFLRIECSVENILFYEDVEHFKSLENDAKLSKSIEIHGSYFKPNSNLELNISGLLKKKFIDEYLESQSKGFISDSIFDDILNEVIDSVLIDTFKRFKRSFIYEDWRSIQEIEL